MTPFAALPFSNPYTALPAACFERVRPTPVPDPRLVAYNPDAAALLGLDLAPHEDATFVACIAGQRVPDRSDPIATAYAGHQFGVFVPQLGDGRAILLGELPGPAGDPWEVQLKGAGQTRFSRFGDGRAVLRSTIREYLASEAMAGLGIPTTRALAIAGSDLPVHRETVETAAILVRLAPSHVRFGTFEYFAARGQGDVVRRLADWVIDRHFPDLEPGPDRYARWLAEVAARTARLVAAWMAAGWSHGVLNTDNMSILGLTIDYGPYGFQDRFAQGYICNHSDPAGRYAWNQQPAVGLWNLTRLAEALLSLMTEPAAVAALEGYQPLLHVEYLRRMRARLGLREARPGDEELVWGLLDALEQDGADYTRVLRGLGELSTREPSGSSLATPRALDPWLVRYRERLRSEASDDGERRERMNRVNPVYILRNYLAERAIRQACDDGDYAEIERLRRLLRNPWEVQPGMERYADAPPDWGRELVVSCSS